MTPRGAFLSVLHYAVYGGPHNRMANLAEPLRRHGLHQLIVIPDEPGNAPARFAAAGAPYVQIPLERLRASRDPRLHWRLASRFAADVARLRGLIREHDARLVVLAGLANPHAAVAARLEGIPVVWQIVDTRVPDPARRGLMTFVERLSDCAMFWGQALFDAHVGERRFRPPVLLGNSPVDLARFAPSAEHRRSARAELGIPDGAPLVGSVSNVNPQKGIEYFVRAAAKVAAARPDAHFVLVGSRMDTHASYAAQIDREIAASGIPPDRFLLLGERSDTHRLLPAMDVKVIASVPASEGIPTTALESMACGVPVVATAAGATAEAVLDGVTGYIVPPCDADRLAAAVLRVLGDPGLRGEMAEAARKRAVGRYGIEASVDLHLRAFGVAAEHYARRRGRGGASSAETAPR